MRMNAEIQEWESKRSAARNRVFVTLGSVRDSLFQLIGAPIPYQFSWSHNSCIRRHLIPVRIHREGNYDYKLLDVPFTVFDKLMELQEKGNLNIGSDFYIKQIGKGIDTQYEVVQVKRDSHPNSKRR